MNSSKDEGMKLFMSNMIMLRKIIEWSRHLPFLKQEKKIYKCVCVTVSSCVLGRIIFLSMTTLIDLFSVPANTVSEHYNSFV